MLQEVGRFHHFFRNDFVCLLVAEGVVDVIRCGSLVCVIMQAGIDQKPVADYLFCFEAAVVGEELHVFYFDDAFHDLLF